MKKQIKKLNLSKKTISNLDAVQLKNLMGGNATNGAGCNTNQCTRKCFSWANQCNTLTCGRSCTCW